MADSANIFHKPGEFFGSDASSGVTDFAGGWNGLSSAADAVKQGDFARGASSAADAAKQYDFARGASSAAETGGQQDFSQGITSARDDLKELYDREYARDLLGQWSWWSSGGGGYGSDGGYGTSSGGYSGFDSGYENPYAAESAESADSSTAAEPEEQSESSPTAAPREENAADSEPVESPTLQPMEKAVLAFREGDYAAAQTQCEEAIRLASGNANVHEFRALCQFAQRDYQDADATLHKLLAAGPGWNWDVLSAFYTSAETYAKQLRALEKFVKEQPKNAGGRFVLAYHYLVLNERDAAVGHLREVVRLQPKDQVSVGMLKSLEQTKQVKVKAAPPRPTSMRGPVNNGRAYVVAADCDTNAVIVADMKAAACDLARLCAGTVPPSLPFVVRHTNASLVCRMSCDTKYDLSG